MRNPNRLLRMNGIPHRGGDALMTIRRTWIAIGRQFVLWAITSAFLASGAALDKAAWAETSEPPSLESIKSSLDEIESSVGSDEITAEARSEERRVGKEW